ncbi:Carbonic anhydrase-related protein 10 [Halotydeus destructor]|nr:Carbonic anhydrase-related protein 10 [Halotydeus destructor]
MDLLPSSTRQYITYAGSLTLPGCSENVDWVLINRPVYVSSQRMDLIRNLVNDLGNNCRPVQPLHRRCVRTNIDFKSNDKMESHNQTASCSMNKFLVSYSSMMSKDRTVQDLSTDYLSYRLATSKRT